MAALPRNAAGVRGANDGLDIMNRSPHTVEIAGETNKGRPGRVTCDEPHGRRTLAASMVECEGFLMKNHAGSVFGTGNRRYFVTEGFTVFYYSKADRSVVKGHFDLRNVVHMRPSSDETAGQGSIDLLIAKPANSGPPKKMVISFSAEPSRRDEWLKLWCSAVWPDYVDASLKPHADAALAERLNGEYADVLAVSASRALFFRRAPTTKVLTPRGGAGGAGSRGSAASNSNAAAGGAAEQPKPARLDTLDTMPNLLDQLDTPRFAMPGSMPGATPDGRTADAPTGTVSEETPATVDERDVIFEITVPENVQPGDRLQATTPTGLKVKLAVPAGAGPGTILSFSLPTSVGEAERESHAAVLIQARLRGSATRRRASASAGGASAAEVLAATRMQSYVRGHAARNDQQEAARLQWMKYYLDLAEWDEALALAVTAEEEAQVAARRSGNSNEEEGRQKWLKHYLATRNFKEAEALVVTPEEAAQVLKAKASATLGCFGVCVGDKELVEAQRREMFAEAIRDYNWQVAETLANSPLELQDISDSKLRVSVFEQALRDGDYKMAAEYAITNKEYEMVSAAQRQS